MPDTAREKAALATLLADNSSGAIVPGNVRDLLVSTHPAAVDLAGPFAGRPTTGLITGMVYRSTDGPYTQRYNGTSWDTWASGLPVTPPDSSAFAGVNMTGATVDATSGSLYLDGPLTSSAGANWHIQKQAAPSTPYTITMGYIPILPQAGASAVGLCFRDSGGKLSAIQMRIADTGVPEFIGVNYASPTSYAAQLTGPGSSGSASSAAHMAAGPMLWLRIGDDGTNRSYGWSADGFHFQTLFVIGRTSYLTATEVGFFLDTYNAYQSAYGGIEAGIDVLSWKAA